MDKLMDFLDNPNKSKYFEFVEIDEQPKEMDYLGEFFWWGNYSYDLYRDPYGKLICRMYDCEDFDKWFEIKEKELMK